uniref:Vps16_C domain-containing protein n=1 Tax=Elaeophora elaphi TaxID=1147741 RepID=A0A0R3RLC0_9BILA
MDRKFLINDSIENEFHQKASEQELAAQMYFEEPLEYAIASLTNLLKYRPYDRNIRLKRCALWKTLQNRENALTDALVYFCTELSKDCLDVPLENINKVLSDDLKLLINEECNQIDSYAQSLKPFLTQDFINLWLSCDCDDPLVEDIWKVRAEELGTLPDGVVPVRDGTYKKALKALSSGKLSSVVKNLEKASLNGKYRLEATLLLALAHTREDGAAVDKFLDRFERIWVQKPAGYSSRRCKQLVVRYVSMSRAIRYDPFSGQKLENETKEIEANLYLQEALIIFWRRQKCEIGEIFWKKELKNDNRRKLQHIQKLCNLALKAKPDFHHAK